MYCTYENKYKLWRDLWITVVIMSPLIVTCDERMMFYFLVCTFWSVVSLWKAGLSILLERYCNMFKARHWDTDTFIVMYCHVLKLELWGKIYLLLCAQIHVSHHEWMSFICVYPHGFISLLCLFFCHYKVTPLTVLYSGFKQCTCPIITRLMCVCVLCPMQPFPCENVRMVV